jgi:quercetin 2,3-dioxygenase
MVISGSFEIENQKLSDRDAIGIWDKETININSLSQDSEILILEIPMEI